MISPINAIQSTATQGTDTTSTASKAADKLGKDDFLKIFMAQIQNQDPMSPMEGTEFTAQLAQFSSLEQLFNVNDNLAAIKDANGNTTRYDVLNFMGKEVVAKGDQLSLGADGTGKGAFQIAGTAGCTVQVMDSSGSVIRNIPLGTLDAGQHHFEWDGLSDSGTRMTAGTYKFAVNAADEAGNPVLADTMISGKVTRVNLEGDSPILYVGDSPFDMGDVLEISDPAEVDSGSV
ncbi:MAG: flagellar hook capping FlgD N-terminal domain-containing protein [Desulfatiglandaceae bacterium]|jgi:flagellar basal-body rod modification protein FlgD